MTHLEMVESVRAEFPTPLYPAHSAAFLVKVVARLRTMAGLAALGYTRKAPGTIGTTLPSGEYVSLDVLMLPDGSAAWDCLWDGENLAKAVWNSLPHDKLPPASAYVPVGGSPIPPTPAPLDSSLLARIAKLEEQVHALTQTAVKDGDVLALETHHSRFVRAWRDPFIMDQSDPSTGIGWWEQLIVRKL